MHGGADEAKIGVRLDVKKRGVEPLKISAEIIQINAEII